jgi:TonB-dependent starch-binding outer membrane protein SusC
MSRIFISAAALLCVACSSNPAPRAPGYGVDARDKVGSSMSSVTRKDLDRFRFSRIEDYIAALVPGVIVSNRGGHLTFQIRGQNTILGNNEPLIVLDGVPLSDGTGGSAVETLSPGDVERIDVLKDAGAAAIYGSRAASGVIIINTRRGR